MPPPRPLRTSTGGGGRAGPAATPAPGVAAARAPRPTPRGNSATTTTAPPPPRPPPARPPAPAAVEAAASVAHQHRRFSGAGPRSGHIVVDAAVVSGEDGGTTTTTLALAHALPALFPTRFPSITAARRACRRGEVLVNGSPAPVDAPLAAGDEVTCTVRAGGGGPGPGPASLVGHRAAGPGAAASAPPPPSVSVAYEDDHLALVVKPPGLATQGAGRGAADVQGLLPRLLRPSGAPGALWRPRPVHRPDAWLGGLVLVAKTRPALAALTSALAAREIAWRYAGLVAGRLTGAGRVAAPLDGRPALTEWAALKAARVGGGRGGWVTAVQLRAVAGPPAQLRRHMALAGHPLVGDALGGGGRGGSGGSLGGAAAAAASAALFAAKRGARRLASGKVGEYDDDDDETRNSASTARARFGRADDRPWAVAADRHGPPGGATAGPLSAAPHPCLASAPGEQLDGGVDDDDAASALSGTTAVDRLRADAAADARAAAREASGGGGPLPARGGAPVPAPTLGVAGRAAGWATRRPPAPLPRASSRAADAADAGSPWEIGVDGAGGGRAAMAAAVAEEEEGAAPRPTPPPPPRAHAARGVVDRLVVDFDPPPLMVAGPTPAPAPDVRGLLATPTPASVLDRRAPRAGVPACLWAVHVSLTHPVTGELLTVAIPPPADLALALPFERRAP